MEEKGAVALATSLAPQGFRFLGAPWYTHSNLQSGQHYCFRYYSLFPSTHARPTMTVIDYIDLTDTSTAIAASQNTPTHARTIMTGTSTANVASQNTPTHARTIMTGIEYIDITDTRPGIAATAKTAKGAVTLDDSSVEETVLDWGVGGRTHRGHDKQLWSRAQKTRYNLLKMQEARVYVGESNIHGRGLRNVALVVATLSPSSWQPRPFRDMKKFWFSTTWLLQERKEE